MNHKKRKTWVGDDDESLRKKPSNEQLSIIVLAVTSGRPLSAHNVYDAKEFPRREGWFRELSTLTLRDGRGHGRGYGHVDIEVCEIIAGNGNEDLSGEDSNENQGSSRLSCEVVGPS